MARKVTINMVAERAGVSRGTVDRVLNQRPHVKPELYDRIVKAMKELGYMPLKESQAKALGLPLATEIGGTLGIVLPNWGGFFKSEIMRGIQDATALLHEFSVDVVTEQCESDLPYESIECMERLIQQGANGLAICAMDHPSVIQKVNELSESGIPVVTFNSDLTNSKRLCFVGQDLVASGRIAGELMSKYLSPNDEIMIAIGNPSFRAHHLRMEGFKIRMEERGFSSSVMHSIETYNDYMLTFQKIGEMLKEIPNIKGIYMANHSVTGCVDAIRQAGKSGQIHVISHDLTDATRRLLKNEDIDFTIAQNIYQQGYRSLILLREYLHKGIVPQDTERSRMDIICSENIDIE